MQSNYVKGAEARERLMAGVMAGNEAVAMSYGAKGKDAIIEVLETPHSIITNDGLSILEKVQVDDLVANVGLNLLKESVSRANKQSGDGSTTACILTAAILEEGQKYVDSGEDIKQSLFDALPAVLKSIDDQTRPITPEEIGKVATISAQSEEMGQMIQDIFRQIGKDGIVDWGNSYSPDTSFEIKDGVELKGVGFAANWMANENAKGETANPFEADRAVIKNPRILLTQEKISTVEQLEPYVKALTAEGVHEMVVFFDDIDQTLMNTFALIYLAGSQKYGKFKFIFLKAPTLWKDWVYEDFALMTGATIIGTNGATWKTPSLTYLGTCEKLVAFRSHTNVIGTKDLTEHIQRLKDGSKAYPDLAARAEWLNSKSAVVKLGARSEVELTHKRYKLEDAANAAKIALQAGIVAGGGVCLLNASKSVDTSTVGGKILKEALQAPIRQIIANAGHPEKFYLGGENGFNAKSGKIVNMFDAGIVDPALIPKNAISSAISVAGTVLACDVVIPLDKTQQTYA